ncbi:GNAT family N-acetyltransferase [Paenibacillus sp. USHLN196]|uniref:GNAT family N-acetyltransferase n=1 Tax=Paenibacillus sp. USHLN196 TaxID=3081291 RepID=UPI00301B2FB1
MNVYESNEIVVRLLEIEDEHHLVKWLSDPEVLQYYEGRDRPHDLDMVREHFYNQDDDATRCIVEYGGNPIGYIQFYELEDQERSEYGYGDTDEIIYGTDQFIGEIDYWNKGIGTQLMQSMLAYLINQQQASKVVMDPQAWNHRAISCYEKCGFQKIKLLEKHEQHEGQMRDCWLMEYTSSSSLSYSE